MSDKKKFYVYDCGIVVWTSTSGKEARRAAESLAEGRFDESAFAHFEYDSGRGGRRFIRIARGSRGGANRTYGKVPKS